MRASLRLLASLGLGAFVLSGCSGTVMQSDIERPGADRYFQHGAAPGEMLAVVVGNPFPVSKQIVDKAVVDAMQGNHHGPMTHFSTQPGPDARPDFRIVMAFNTPNGFHPYDLCRNPSAIPSGQGSERLQLLAGFCVGDKLYSQAKVSASSVPSPTDPRFANMVRTAMWELVPTQDPFDKKEGCKFMGCS